MIAGEQANRRALLLLTAGSVAGVLLGIALAFHENGSRASVLPDDAIALVNGRIISEEEYTRAVALLASDKRTEVTEADRAHVLNRLLEEELLVQQGIASGLVDTNPTVRQAITQAMLASIAAESVSVQPTEEALRAFYTGNPSLFARSGPTTRDQVEVVGTAEEPPAFEEIREQVEAMYLRRARGDALREYLQWLRNEAKIALASEART
jgi:hypothetical protein